MNHNDGAVSVGVVSKQYQLVQHSHVYAKAANAIKDADINLMMFQRKCL